MSRNIWNTEEDGTPIPVDPEEVPELLPNAIPGEIRPTLTEDQIKQIDAKIAQMEAQPSLVPAEQELLDVLKASRAALG